MSDKKYVKCVCCGNTFVQTGILDTDMNGMPVCSQCVRSGRAGPVRMF